MRPFCSNPECQYHEYKVKQNQYYINIVKDNNRHRIERHLYADTEGNKLEVCTVCHSAIQMIKPTRNF